MGPTMNTAIIRDYVLQECRRSENVLGAAFFDQHLAVVAEYADCLAQRLGANREVVELAAWLHDISAVRDARTLADHARISAEQAGRLLAEHGYPADLIESVGRDRPDRPPGVLVLLCIRCPQAELRRRLAMAARAVGGELDPSRRTG